MIRFFTVFVSLFFCLMQIQSQESKKGYWLARYLSVSHPLKHMSVTSGYGSRKDPFTGEKSTHSGIDFRADYEDVYAMFDGVVERIGSDKRSGNYVILRHGNYTVSYCHLSKRHVDEGEEVVAGMPVAVSGSTGRSTGAHLHLTVKKDGKVINPNILLNYIEHVRSECIAALGGKPVFSEAMTMSSTQFIEHYATLAMEIQKEYGIPASVTLSQMAHESRFGRSELARSANNYFGIKASRKWILDGRPYSVHDDDRKGEKFCNYGTAEESMQHYAKVLSGSRYDKCRNYAPTDYHGWLTAIKKAGYATDPKYVGRCEQIIKAHKLYLYDHMALDT